MRPDAQTAMQAVLIHGPSHLPHGLFAGDGVRTLLGLKAHANTITHARFVAMEETFPRTRAAMGAEAFHAVAERHLSDASALARPLAAIGSGFPGRLTGAARDLARVEWAWLEAHGGADAPPFDLAAIANLSAEQLADAPVQLHPAARLVAIDRRLTFDGQPLTPPTVLVTRPHGEVLLTLLGDDIAPLTQAARHGCTIAALLDADAAVTTMLVGSGALTLSPETL